MSGAFWCVGKNKDYNRFPDISGAFWCVEKGRIMIDVLIFLVPIGVLKRVELRTVS